MRRRLREPLPAERRVFIEQKAERELLGISFRGGGETVSWTVQFAHGNR